MKRILSSLAIHTLILCLASGPGLLAGDVSVSVTTPMSPPSWALLQRELLRANTAACEEFFERYFDERGYLMCVERWGADDGPDDAIETLMDWPILHALGAPDSILHMYRKGWEGNLRQFTAARTVDVPFARNGMYYKEFHVKMDWFHIAEGLTVFNVQGLSDPHDEKFQKRAARYAGFYMNEDPGAANYDPKHRIIRSLFNGSRGPLLRKATALDWAGDPIEVKHRFHLIHGERSYEQMLAHFEDYTDIVGDHPLNLLSTCVTTNAYMISHEARYRQWVLEYVDAWYNRMRENGNIIPTNIGLDGTLGGETDGKWYGGAYGWAFTVVVPQTGEPAHRNGHWHGFTGFMNAVLLTGDQRYVDIWRRQIDTVNSQKKIVDGQTLYPHMYGDEGWYDYTSEKYNRNALKIYYLSMNPDDLQYVPSCGWTDYLQGKDSTYPLVSMRSDLDRIRRMVQGMRKDETTPDTRLSDDPLRFKTASVTSLIELMLGGLPPGRVGGLLHCRLRYFDPSARRAGVPEDIAALVSKMTDDEVTVSLVNTNQVQPRTIVVQAGGYAEHQFTTATVGNRTISVQGPNFTVRLAPGTGSELVLRMKRYANQPTLAFPWDRGWMLGAESDGS